MYTALLSIALLGLVPVTQDAYPVQAALSSLPVAPPAMVVELGQPLSASGVVIVEPSTGNVLFSKQANIRRPMGSLTKLMTALIIVENHDLTELVRVPADVTSVEGSRAYLVPGARYRLGDLLTALLVSSANDAAYTLALYHSGDIPTFVAAMNARAQELGLKDTAYGNVSGLDNAKQYSTPRDIAWLMAYDLRQPELAKRMQMPSARIVSLNGDVHNLQHTHTMLKRDPAVVAGKTGTTDAARECLVSLLDLDGHQYVVVLLHSDERYADLRMILREFRSSIASL